MSREETGQPPKDLPQNESNLPRQSNIIVGGKGCKSEMSIQDSHGATLFLCGQCNCRTCFIKFKNCLLHIYHKHLPTVFQSAPDGCRINVVRSVGRSDILIVTANPVINQRHNDSSSGDNQEKVPVPGGQVQNNSPYMQLIPADVPSGVFKCSVIGCYATFRFKKDLNSHKKEHLSGTFQRGLLNPEVVTQTDPENVTLSNEKQSDNSLGNPQILSTASPSSGNQHQKVLNDDKNIEYPPAMLKNNKHNENTQSTCIPMKMPGTSSATPSLPTSCTGGTLKTTFLKTSTNVENVQGQLPGQLLQITPNFSAGNTQLILTVGSNTGSTQIPVACTNSGNTDSQPKSCSSTKVRDLIAAQNFDSADPVSEAKTSTSNTQSNFNNKPRSQSILQSSSVQVGHLAQPAWFKCYCLAIFKHRQNLELHLKCHKQESKKRFPFYCTSCHKPFHCWKLMHYHLVKAHKYGIANDLGLSLLKCALCEFRTDSSEELFEHQKTHEGYLLICSICGKGFNNQAKKLLHSYQCPFCLKKCHNKVSLKTHLDVSIL